MKILPVNLLHPGLSAYVQPSAKPSAAQISLKRSELRIASRRPRRALDTVTTLCRLMAHVPFIPSYSVRRTSDGTPRIVEVIGAPRDGRQIADSALPREHDNRPLFVGAREPVQADYSARYRSGHDATRSQSAASLASSGGLR